MYYLSVLYGEIATKPRFAKRFAGL